MISPGLLRSRRPSDRTRSGCPGRSNEGERSEREILDEPGEIIPAPYRSERWR